MSTRQIVRASLPDPPADTVIVSTPGWRRNLRWTIGSGPVPGSGSLLDAAAIALTPLAQARGWALRLEGLVDVDLLAQLEEYQEAFAKLHPGIFSRVPVSASSVGESNIPTGAQGTVLAFSGGVDSVWTLLANQTGEFGFRTKEIVAAIQFHGFDLSLADTAAHRRAATHAMAITSAFDVPLGTVNTNWREEFSPNYTLSFVAGLAAGLRRYSGIADVGIVTLDNHYGHETVGWGSSSSTNPLLGSRRFPIRSAGGGRSRFEKITDIARYPVVRQHIRSCWEGTETAGENCGRCEKCLRTMLGFAAAGYQYTGAFGRTEAPLVRTIRARTAGQLAYLDELVGVGLAPDLEDALDEAIEHSRMLIDVMNDPGTPP